MAEPWQRVVLTTGPMLELQQRVINQLGVLPIQPWQRRIYVLRGEPWQRVRATGAYGEPWQRRDIP